METAPSASGLPFGRYHLHSLIGKGGMGEIYLATGPGVAGVEKRLAIKKLLPALADDPGFVARFLDEARLVVALSHGNIVPVFEAGRVGTEYFLAMEYVEGCNLREIVSQLAEQKAQLPVPLALFIAYEVSRGLDYAHRKCDPEGHPLQLIHRDVSPQNVLVGFDGQVRLVDFGIAKAAGKSQRTLTGGLLGKLAFMSPEQAMGLPLDARSDTFSLGVVLHELLTGRPLFDGDTDPEVLRKVQAAEVPLPSSLRAGVGAGLDALMLKMLARDPKDRSPRMADVTQELGRLLYAESGAGAGDLATFLSTLFPDQRSHAPDPLALGPGALPVLGPQTASMTPESVSLPVPRAPSRAWAALLLAIPASAALGYALKPAPPLVALAPPMVQRALPSVHPERSAAESKGPLTPAPPLLGVAGGSAVAAATAPAPAPVLTSATPPSAPVVTPAAPSPAPTPVHAPSETPPPHRTKSEPKPVEATPVHRAPLGEGYLSLRIIPWGEVLIDGTKVAETAALVRHPLSAGPHKVVVRNEPLGREEALDVTVAVGANEVRKVDLKAAPTP